MQERNTWEVELRQRRLFLRLETGRPKGNFISMFKIISYVS